MDYRKYKREEFNISVSVIINNKKIDSTSVNISAGGALLRIENKDAQIITGDDVGKQAEFDFNSLSTSGKISGKIIRLYENLNEILIAVIFLRIY